MLAVLEETVAYLLELCRETDRTSTSTTRGFPVAPRPNHVSNTNSII